VQVALATNKTLPALLKGKLVKGVLVKGAKQAMQSSLGAGAGLAASALSGLPVTTFEPMAVPDNFTRGQCHGKKRSLYQLAPSLLDQPCLYTS